MPPLVSIIIPVYKVEGFLNRCIDSILSQTYQNIEIILIDDGSPDNSGKICDDYGQIDTRIKVLHKKNGGVSSARNQGIELAKGDFITFIDSDDYVSSNHISDLLKSYEENIDLITSSFVVIKNNNKYEVKNENISFSLNQLGKKEFQKLFDSSMCYIWNKLYKKSIIDSNNIRFVENVAFGEDTIFIYTYLKHVNRIKFLNDCTYFYEDKDSTATKKYWPNLFDYLKMEMNVFLEFLNLTNADMSIRQEVLGFYSTRFFRLLVNRHITKKPFFKFLREYSSAYNYFSVYFFKSTMIKGEKIDEDEKVLLKKRKWNYLFFVIKKILKQKFRKNKKKNN